MKYFCRECKTFITRVTEYTGNLIKDERGMEVKEVKVNIVFIPVRMEYERKGKSKAPSTLTKLYHSPCIERFKTETSFEIPDGQSEVVMVD